MTRSLILIGIGLILLVLQATLLPALHGDDQPKPDLPLMFVVYLAFSRGATAGATSGFLMGMVFDAMSRGLLGLGAFAKTLSGYLVGTISRQLIMESLGTHLLALFLITVVHEVVIFTLGSVFEVVTVRPAELAKQVLLVAALNCGVAFVLYRILDMIPLGQQKRGQGPDLS